MRSIAAVSKTEIVTKSNSEIIGTKITVTGGEFGEISDAGRFIGTDVCVKNLFFNTPARMKFLKKRNHRREQSRFGYRQACAFAP